MGRLFLPFRRKTVFWYTEQICGSLYTVFLPLVIARSVCDTLITVHSICWLPTPGYSNSMLTATIWWHHRKQQCINGQVCTLCYILTAKYAHYWYADCQVRTLLICWLPSPHINNILTDKYAHYWYADYQVRILFNLPNADLLNTTDSRELETVLTLKE